MAERGRHSGHRNTAVIAALCSNLAIAAAKLAGAVITHSASMLAEGIHSMADTGNQFLLLLGGRRSRRAATPEHPFGYGRERYFWAFVVALVLFTMGAMFAVFEGVEKVRHPHPITDARVAFAILGFAILAEGFSFRTAMRETRSARGDAGLAQFIRNAKVPELPVVLLEDTAALCGLALALAALITAVKTGNPRWDGFGTIGIGVLLGIVAIVLAWEMKSLLIGEAASHKVQEAIRAAIEIEPGVIGLIHMRTEHVGPDELLICAKVEFEHRMTLPEVAEAVNRVERNVRANVESARLMYIEPDVARDKRVGPTVPEHTSEHEISDELRARLEAERQAAERPMLPPLRAELLDSAGITDKVGRVSRGELRQLSKRNWTMAIRLGDEAPDFTAETTEGTLDFYDWKGDSWAVLFSHPKDFTPVCTTELGRVASLKPEFDKRNTKVIGLSVDQLENHKAWGDDIEDVTGSRLNYPVIADTDHKVADLYDMIHPNANDTLTVRSVFVIGPDNKVKLTLTYPASTGRNFDEILRVVDSLQLTANYKVATPADWKDGDDVIITGAVSDEEAVTAFPKGFEAKKPYLRVTPQPNK